MGTARLHAEIFRKGSRTYFNSSLFFPRHIRERVFTLYAFVRTADDFVDAVPQQGENFLRFRQLYREAREGRPAGDRIIDPFLALAEDRGFDPAWTEAFLDSMEADLSVKNYDRLEDTLGYIYGSAEVIGFFMARLMELPEEALPAAAMLGRAMQYINFIRDLAEDAELGRRYLPLNGADPRIIREDYARAHPDEFARFMARHLGTYRNWQTEAEAGYRFIPRRYRAPIATAGDMYFWTADRIAGDPLIVFDTKVKPRRSRIVSRVLHHIFFGGGG